VKTSVIPLNERERLDELRRYKALDTEFDGALDDLTFLAAEVCGTAIALVSLVDDSRQWFKSRRGLKDLSVSEMPRDVSFCGHAILGTKVFVVPDASKDPRFTGNPLVQSAPRARFYAGAPLITPRGFVIGALCVIDHRPREISDEQILALEALSRQVIGQLELRLSLSRTEEAREEALRACRVKTEFLSNMSHEMRTPLNGILGMADLLADSFASREAREKLKIIKQCGRSLLDLINDILDFSELDAGKVELDNGLLNPHELVEGILHEFSAEALEKRISLAYRRSESVPPRIVADSQRLRQIFRHLIGNAIKFSDSGTVEVALSSRELPGGRIEVLARVSDTGIGISENIRDKLFRAFSQGDGSTTRRFGGIGLGLAICERLCAKMGGKIWVESETGKGSVFSFTFGARAVLDAASAESSTDHPVLQSEFARAHPHRILIAEDSQLNQVILLGLLGKLGYSADVVTNGADALRSLSVNSYDVIFMDCLMPVMDGFETAERIRRGRLSLHQPKIVAVTASVNQENIDRCKRSGMDDFVSKPIQAEALARVLMFPRASAPNAEAKRESVEGETLQFDRERLLSNFRGIEDLLLQAIAQFCDQAPQMVRAVTDAAERKDGAALEIAAHSLKGSVSNFYCDRADYLTWTLEQMGRGAVDPEVMTFVNELKTVVMGLCVALTDFSRKLR